MTKLTTPEIDRLEVEIGHSFPAVYRRLLETVGHGLRDDGARIYHPAEIAASYEFHFEDPDDLFNRYFPIGCQEQQQEIWLIDVASGKTAAIWHETHPDDYLDEDWQTPTDWAAAHHLGS